MYNWFEFKVKYDKTTENGMVKTVSETYLMDALSFTEVEARAVEEMKPYISGEFSISDIRRVKYSETLFSETGDRYYKAKLYFFSLDEKSGSLKKTATNMLVQASELKEAVEAVEAEMKKTMIDYAIAAVSETAVIDLFLYDGTRK